MVYIAKTNRDHLVERAYALVEHEGAEALSMRRLAQIVGVRVSSLYHHFPEKASLLQAVAEKGLLALATELERVHQIIGEDPHHQLQAMGITYREWALQHPQLYQLLFADTPPIEDATSVAPTAAFAPVLATTTQLVGVSQAANATQAFWAFVHGYVMLELTGHMQKCIPVEGFQLGLSCFLKGLTIEESGHH
jgi:AcrR family transcriptional regulator